jgi:hypothetical protein
MTPRLRSALPTIVAALGLLLIPGAAHAGWSRAIPLAPGGQPRELLALAATGDDRSVVLLQHRTGRRAAAITLRGVSPAGRVGAERTIARPAHEIETATLAAGADDDLVAGWVEKVDGIPRGVVASGPRLATRQLLTLPSGPREIEDLVVRANRRGDALVAFWRWRNRSYEVWAAYRPAGGRFDAPQLLAAGVEVDEHAAAAIDERGGASVGWLRDGHVELATRPAGAPAFGPPAAITAARPRAHTEFALAAGGGRTVLAWQAGNSKSQAIQVSERPSPAGATGAAAGPFSSPQTLTSPGRRLPSTTDPKVAISGDRTLVTWIQMRARIGSEHAALAVRKGDGAWAAPRTITLPAPRHIVESDLVAGPAGRPPLLAVMASRNLRNAGGTATIRPDGTLSPLRLPVGAVDIGSFPLLAQGPHHAWMGVRNIRGGVPGTYPGTPLLLRS